MLKNKWFIDLVVKFFPQKNYKILLGISGGPDSIFLLEVFNKFLEKKKFAIAHFNHNWRGEESIKDFKFVKNIAEKLQVKFFSETWKNPKKSENDAREARRNFFFSITKKFKFDAICLGTNFDDNVETIFFNFLRGSGINGLSGIPIFDSKTKIFRPLLFFRKKEILEFLEKRKIKFCIDKTNFDTKFSRNFLRQKIFPNLQKKFPNFPQNLVRQSKIFQRTNHFLQKKVQNFLKNFVENSSKNEQKINRKEFLKTDLIEQSEILRTIFFPKNFDFQQIENIIFFIKTAKNNKKMTFVNSEILIFGNFFFVRKI